jgi:uncharacterized membrane protein YphA (DoxX/SURF4 family)
MKTLSTPGLESAAVEMDRKTDLAWANFIPRAILGFSVLFSGLSRFQFGFPEYAKLVGAIPYAERFLPAPALFGITTVVPCAEIVLGIMIMMGLRTRQVLVILGTLIVIVTAGAGVTGLVTAAVDVGQRRTDGSGLFGPTGTSITFLENYTYPLAALVLFLLLLPGGSDRYSVDRLLHWTRRGVSDATARAAAIFLARVLGGLVWFIGGINKVFIWGAIEHARNLFVVPYAGTFLPAWSLWASGTVIPFLEFVFPALVMVGLWTRPSLHLLGGILILVTFGHLLVMPLSIERLEDFIFARAILLLLVLMFPPEADYYSIDGLLRRRRSSGA